MELLSSVSSCSRQRTHAAVLKKTTLVTSWSGRKSASPCSGEDQISTHTKALPNHPTLLFYLGSCHAPSASSLPSPSLGSFFNCRRKFLSYSIYSTVTLGQQPRRKMSFQSLMPVGSLNIIVQTEVLEEVCALPKNLKNKVNARQARFVHHKKCN